MRKGKKKNINRGNGGRATKRAQSQGRKGRKQRARKIRKTKPCSKGTESQSEQESSFPTLVPLDPSPEWGLGGGKWCECGKMEAFLNAKAIQQLAEATGTRVGGRGGVNHGE